MNRDEERKLIVGVLSAGDPDEAREESLARVLDTVRHERRRRRTVRSVALVSAPLLVALVFTLVSSREPDGVTPLAQAPRPTAPAAPITRSGIEPIDDQQLLDLLPGKTVALIGPRGQERLLVFDAPRRLP